MANPLRFISNLFGTNRKTTHGNTDKVGLSRDALPRMIRSDSGSMLAAMIEGVGGGSSTKALQVSTAFACIDRIAKDIASLPIRPLRTINGGKEIAKDHDQYFITKYPSPLFSRYTWTYTLVFHQYQYGECFSPITRKSGRPVEYGIWKPTDVEHKLVGNKSYWVNTKTKEVKSDDDMIHIMDYTEDGIRGKSRLSLAKQTIDLASYGSKMATALYKNQNWQAGYISFKTDYTSEQAEMISKTWGSKGGEQDTYEPPILDNGGEYKHFGMSLKDSDFSPVMKNAALEICRFFGMPPSKVGIMEGNVSYNSLEQENIGYTQDTLMPVCVNHEHELDRKALTVDDLDTVGFKYELKGRLRGDMAARAAFYQMGLTTGLLSINDTLRLEDMDTIGPEGDERYINAASVPLSKLFSGELDESNQDDQIKQLVKGLKLNGNGTHKVQ